MGTTFGKTFACFDTFDAFGCTLEEKKLALEHKKSGLSAIRFSIRSP